MDKFIFVNLNMFSLNSNVYIMDKEGHYDECGGYPFEKLPEVLSLIAHDNNLYKIRIIGNQLYAEELIESIHAEEMKNYSENKIEIEVL